MMSRQFWFRVLTFVGALTGAVCPRAADNIEVTGKSSEVIPIALHGYAGEVRKVLEFDLEVAGFRVVPAGQGSLELTGKADGAVEGTLADAGKRTLFARSYRDASLRQQAHRLADDVATEVLGQKGIARTKVAFKVETGQRNRKGDYISEIYVADYDGANAVQLTQDDSMVRSPAWVPGRRQLLYTSYRTGRPCVYSHDLGSGNRLPVSAASGMNDGAAVSPDGSRLALVLSKAGSPDIWVADVDGGNLRAITATKEEEASPCWSADGRTLCFSSREGGVTRLYLAPAGGGTMKSLATGGLQGVTEPDWSPDGKWIAFTRMGRGENFEVHVAPAGGGTAQFIGAGEDPAWAANSRTLMVVRRVRNGAKRLSLLDVPTRRAKDVVTISGSCSQPSWAR
jgi:TolB protein